MTAVRREAARLSTSVVSELGFKSAGAAVGAAIGTALMPGLGTIVGDFVGGGRRHSKVTDDSTSSAEQRLPDHPHAHLRLGAPCRPALLLAREHDGPEAVSVAAVGALGLEVNAIRNRRTGVHFFRAPRSIWPERRQPSSEPWWNPPAEWQPRTDSAGDYLPFAGGLFPRPPPDGWPVLLGALAGGLAGGLFPRPPPEGLPVVLGAFTGVDFVAIALPHPYLWRRNCPRP